jgi:hypothetical protein
MPRGINQYDEARLQGRNVANANSVNIVSPGIVTAGIVLNLDAGNYNSYPIAGTTWYDLSERRTNAILANGPTYARADGGSISFDGNDDKANFTQQSLTTVASVEIWAKLGTNFSGKMFFAFTYYSVFCNNGRLGFNTANSDLYGISPTAVTNLGIVNNWKHFVFEMRSDVSYTNNKIYVNGGAQGLSQQEGTEATNTRAFFSGVTIANWGGSGSYPMPMNCAVFRIYNRALAPAEISQNFNATRARFGI